MSTVRVQVTAEDIAAADTDSAVTRVSWWQWPVKRALEAFIGVSVDVDRDMPDGYMATIGEHRGDATVLVTNLDVNAEAFLDARFDRNQPGEPFFFEITLPEWLCALVDEAIDDDASRCRVCGCTDEQACAGGCMWVPDPAFEGDLCSACLPGVMAARA
jgi:hypothetical protein